MKSFHEISPWALVLFGTFATLGSPPVARAAVPSSRADLPEALKAKVLNETQDEIFTLERTLETQSPRTLSRATYRDLSGSPIITETAEFENGVLRRLEIQRLKESEGGFAEIRDGKIHFSWTARGETKTDVEDLPPNLVTGPTMEPYLRKHWDRLVAGEDVHVRFIALDRQMTVGFNFFKVSETRAFGTDAVEIRMKPSSPFIALVVPKLIFWFERATGRLLSFEGRLFPKLQSGNHWKDVDGKIIYSYLSPPGRP